MLKGPATHWNGQPPGSLYAVRSTCYVGCRYLRPRPHRRQRLRAILVRAQVPLEEGPRPVPGVDLRRGVDALERHGINAAAERVAHRRSPWRGVLVDLRL